jgi:hypothetical protein
MKILPIVGSLSLSICVSAAVFAQSGPPRAQDLAGTQAAQAVRVSAKPAVSNSLRAVLPLINGQPNLRSCTYIKDLH